jgi:hypothetical protein
MSDPTDTGVLSEGNSQTIRMTPATVPLPSSNAIEKTAPEADVDEVDVHADGHTDNDERDNHIVKVYDNEMTVKKGANMSDATMMADFELSIAQKKHEIHRLDNDTDKQKEDLEIQKHTTRISNDHVTKNHEKVMFELLEMNKKEYNFCMEDADTEEEKTMLLKRFKKKKADILNDNMDEQSTSKLISRHGLDDGDGLLGIRVNTVLVTAAAKEAKKRKREDETERNKIEREEKKRVRDEETATKKEEKRIAKIVYIQQRHQNDELARFYKRGGN